MFSAIRSLIQTGDLRKARQALEESPRLSSLTDSQLLEYFQLLRRVGAFQTALVRLEKIPSPSAELCQERALLLGELGAIDQAIGLLGRGSPESSSRKLQISVAFHLGNFQSLRHRYAEAESCFARMLELSAGFDETNVMIARLNVLGSRVYAGRNLAVTLAELEALDEVFARKFPLLSQGVRYFRTVGLLALDQVGMARAALKSALELGEIHNLRENLLLTLTRFHLDILEPETRERITSREWSLLRRSVLAQPHIVYFDQFHYLAALFSKLTGQESRLTSHRNRVLFGGRRHRHYQAALELSEDASGEVAWELRGGSASPASRRKLLAQSLRCSSLPALKTDSSRWLLKPSEIQTGIIVALARCLDFGMRDAELWQTVWQQPYRANSSPGAIRQAIFRLRHSSLGEAAEVRVRGGRLVLRLRPGARLYV